MQTITEYSLPIKERFEQVLAALDALTYHIQHDLASYPIWAEAGEMTFDDNRVKLCFAIKKLEFDFSLEPQETTHFVGAVASNERTLDLVKAVNDAKLVFKAACIDYHGSPLYHYTLPASKILARFGYSGISLKHAYRQLVFVPYHPRRIAWGLTSDASHKVITALQAKNLLAKAGRGEHIEIQQQKIDQSLAASDKLVIRHMIKPRPAVNISEFNSGQTSIHKIETSLPVFFQADETKPLPIVCFSKPQQRMPRKDRRLEEEPFLKSIQAFRYKHRNVQTGS